MRVYLFTVAYDTVHLCSSLEVCVSSQPYALLMLGMGDTALTNYETTTFSIHSMYVITTVPYIGILAL